MGSEGAELVSVLVGCHVTSFEVWMSERAVASETLDILRVAALAAHERASCRGCVM